MSVRLYLVLTSLALLIALTGAVALLLPPRADAATFVVNDTGDAVDAALGNGSCATAGAVCTLRAAIQEANALGGADTITLPAGTYTLGIGGADEDVSATGDLDITGDLTINGAGAGTTTVDGGGIDRVFQVVSGTVSISGVTIRNGAAFNLSPFQGSGGGIYNVSGSTLTLSDSRSAATRQAAAAAASATRAP
ncbi:MAG TPA: CSLREA domain-containing protein [Dehalococcoidia bacterium]|nr:CSLREA domain-containing protein [Dehalococcoidia bacterium]